MTNLDCLPDSHVWPWCIAGDEKLSSRAAALIAEPSNQVLVSAISIWEVVLKTQVGKLSVDGDLIGASSAQGISFHPFAAQHAQSVRQLPLHHRDPFAFGSRVLI